MALEDCALHQGRLLVRETAGIFETVSVVLPRACLSKTIVVFKNANQIIMDGSVLTEQAYGFLDRDRPARV